MTRDRSGSRGMRSADLLRLAADSLLRNPLRSALTMLGIVIGVGAVILMVAVGYGARSTIEEQVGNLGTNLLVITPGAATQAGVSQGAQSFNRLTVEDAERLAREGTLFAGVSPVIFSRVQVIGAGGNWRTEVNGVAASYRGIRDWSLTSGDFFTEADLLGMRKVVVLGATVAGALFPDSDPVGQQVQVRNVPFTIVGVLSPKGQTASGMDQDDVVVVPYTTMRTRLAGFSFVGQLLLSTAAPADLPAAEEEARSILRSAHRLAAAEDDDFTVRNQDELADLATSSTAVMSGLLAAIASISLVVGGIGIMNIMLVSVTERTREIGLRLAVGARGTDVLTQFLVESVALCTIGGLAGMGLGYGGAAIVAGITGWNVATPPEAALLAVGFSALVGVFFGYYPARKAAHLDPIAALRYE